MYSIHWIALFLGKKIESLNGNEIQTDIRYVISNIQSERQ